MIQFLTADQNHLLYPGNMISGFDLSLIINTKNMPALNRRHFLKASGIAIIPAILPAAPAIAGISHRHFQPADPVIRFFGDSDFTDPAGYIEELSKINAREPIKRDFYGQGGVVSALEKKFTEITGKERSVMMPSGTLANQLAISVLSGEKTKVYVQDTSHVYRDEADAAQSVFGKRLMPLAKEETAFTADQLKDAIESLKKTEVFESGIGAVSIENPVRRTDGRMVPLEEIRKISSYCRANNIRLHLDGARIHMASAWSGISIKEYASYFDTIYISLYKYLGAGSGAVLSGDAAVMEKMPHLVKIHGGTMFSNWQNAAIALNRLDTIDSVLKNAISRAGEVFAAINKLKGIKITALDQGTNIYAVEFESAEKGKKIQEELNRTFKIRIPLISSSSTQFTVNETILYRDAAYIIQAFTKSLLTANG